MSIKLRLVAMNFMQFFVWGAWLITIGAYWFQYRHWSGAQVRVLAAHTRRRTVGSA